jgi:hypothetical protein
MAQIGLLAKATILVHVLSGRLVTYRALVLPGLPHPLSHTVDRQMKSQHANPHQ